MFFTCYRAVFFFIAAGGIFFKHRENFQSQRGEKNRRANDDGGNFSNDVINWGKMSFGKVSTAISLERQKKRDFHVDVVNRQWWKRYKSLEALAASLLRKYHKKKIIRLLRHFWDVSCGNIFIFLQKGPRHFHFHFIFFQEKWFWRKRWFFACCVTLLEDYKTQWFIQQQIICLIFSGRSINKTFLIKHFQWNCLWFVGWG